MLGGGGGSRSGLLVSSARVSCFCSHMQNMGCCCGLKQKGGGSASHSERAAPDSKLGPLSYTVPPFAFWLPPVKHRWAKDVLRALSLSLGDADNQ